MNTVYLASPLGFSEVGRDFMYSTLIPAIKGAGVTKVEDPWALTAQKEIDEVMNLPYGEERRAAWTSLNRLIASRNVDAIKRSDALIAVLDGVDVDSGTASEIGFGFGLGHLILGYRGDFRLAGDNEGAMVNLQVEHFINESGGTIVSSMEALTSKISSVIGVLHNSPRPLS